MEDIDAVIYAAEIKSTASFYFKIKVYRLGKDKVLIAVIADEITYFDNFSF